MSVSLEHTEAIAMSKKQIQPGETVPLKLTVAERKLIREDLLCLDGNYDQVIREGISTTLLSTRSWRSAAQFA
jgi:hypothetical protein